MKQASRRLTTQPNTPPHLAEQIFRSLPPGPANSAIAVDSYRFRDVGGGVASKLLNEASAAQRCVPGAFVAQTGTGSGVFARIDERSSWRWRENIPNRRRDHFAIR